MDKPYFADLYLYGVIHNTQFMCDGMCFMMVITNVQCVISASDSVILRKHG